MTPCRRIVLAALLSGLPALAASGRGDWQRLPGLIDLRYARAEALPMGADGPVLVTLSRPWTGLGGTWTHLRVGPGWVRPMARAALPGVGLAGQAIAGELPRQGPRLDLLSGDGLRDAGAVLLETTEAGTVLRWTRLEWSGGSAALELLLPHGSAPRLQFLRVSEDARRRVLGGELVAGAVEGLSGSGLLPSSGEAWRLGPETAPLLGPRAEPHADGPAPPGCDAATGDWCAQAGGLTTIFLNETFDDGLSAGRGWTASGEWTETVHSDCAPGASFDPGGAWYFGDKASCSYARRSSGDLTSPSFGPITATTSFTFSFRLDMEQCSFPTTCEEALILVNGTPQWSLGNPGNPNAWFNLQAIDLSPWAGQTITLGFRFQSDNSVEQLGWFIDDLVVWDEAAGQPNCVLDAAAGRGGLASCSDRMSTQWSFNERAFCEGCSYTFYALVECGREMHLPLWDMEGAGVTVTDMLTGLPVSLSCRNETARADASELPYPVVISGDCCAGGGDEEWWGPAFEETDNAGAGQVSWGLPSCPSLLVYDANGNGAVECAELPGCGGELDELTPGENQVMDCSISDADGLCGIFRIDIVSGGFVWDLFANCDGTNLPQFPIFHDCTDAWAAWNPLPELAVTNLVVDDGCPALTATFDIANLGCSDHEGDLTVRLVSDCLPADSIDHLVPGPFPAGSTVPVSVPFNVSCSPLRVEVFVDPDDAIAECTESPAAAACNAEAGVDSLAAFSCGCTAALNADAGAPLQGCEGETVELDGSASTIAPCSEPLYRWLGPGGGVLRDWDPDPSLGVAVAACAADVTYTLEVSCQGEPCFDSDTVTLSCFAPTPPVPVAIAACPGADVSLHCGAEDPALSYTWDTDTAFDADGDGDPANDADAMGCDLLRPYPAGDHQVAVTATDARGCSVRIPLDFRIEPEAEPPPVLSLRVLRSGDALELAWAPATGADSHRLLSGTLGLWYDHAADDAAGQGTCDTAGATAWSDPDDVSAASSHYYLVTSLSPCGMEGSAGVDSLGLPRPGRVLSAGCP